MEIQDKINDAFFRLESFMSGRIEEYRYFGFDKAFTLLFEESIRPENYTYENCKLIGKYYGLISQISYDTDKGDYDNVEFIYNEDNENEVEEFWKDVNELYCLQWDKLEEFDRFTTQDEIGEENKRISIIDITKVQQPKISLKTFPEYLNHDKPEALAEALKKKFQERFKASDVNKRVALFIYALRDRKIIDAEILTPLFEALKDFFKMDKGTIPNVQKHIDYNYELKADFSDNQKREYIKDIQNILNNL